MEPQTIIARRIGRELSEGMLVNLGIGIPTLVASYVPEGVSVFFQSENGLIGTGAPPEIGMAHPTLTDAGGKPVTALPGASTFDSAMSHSRRPCRSYSPWRPASGSNRASGQLDDPGQDGARHGRSDGSGHRRKACRGDAARRQGEVEDCEKVHAAHHFGATGGSLCHGPGGDRISGRPCNTGRDSPDRHGRGCGKGNGGRTRHS
jgi:hypothetical protein